jgi:vitamin B12 transporter
MDKRILVFACSLLAARAWAEDLPELPEVVVTASRTLTSVLESPSFVTLITPSDIAGSGASDVAGVLSHQSGVVINDYGPQGSSKSVSIRGSTSDQVLVLLDGMRLNSSRDGLVDLSQITTENIDHIEMVRGSTSTMYGTGGVGGVINIITKKAGTPGITLRITNGSYMPRRASEVAEGAVQTSVPADPMDLLDSQKIDLSLAGTLGELGVSGGGSLRRAANAFSWNDTSPAALGGIGDWRRRTNAQMTAANGYAGVEAPLLDGTLTAKGVFAYSDIGAPGSLKFVSSKASQQDTSASASLSFSTDRFLTDALTLDVKGFYRYEELAYSDPNYPPASLHRTHSASLDVTQKIAFSDLAAAVYGASAWYDLADSSNFSAQRDRLNCAGFLSLPFSPGELVTITPSARYDYFSDFPGYLSLQIGAVILLSDASSLKATIGSAYRVPTLNELYWFDPFGYTAANPSLKPETSYSGDIGWALEENRLVFEASVFARLVFDQIEWVSDPVTYVYAPVNISRSLLPGAEIHAKAALTDLISVEANYAFIYSLLLEYAGESLAASENRRVPYVPLHNLSVGARYQDDATTLHVELQYVGQKYTDATNTASTALSEYLILNADYRYAATKSLAFSIGLLNILDAEYQTTPGYPMPPFSIVLGMELKL